MNRKMTAFFTAETLRTRRVAKNVISFPPRGFAFSASLRFRMRVK